MGLVSSEKASGPDSKLWSQNYNGKRFKPWTQSGIHVRISQSSGLDPESMYAFPSHQDSIRNLGLRKADPENKFRMNYVNLQGLTYNYRCSKYHF